MSPNPTLPSSPFQVQVRIPDLMANWPWPRELSPFCNEITQASLDWIHSLNPFDSEKQKIFDKIEAGLLASVAYPRCQKDIVRLGADINNFLFAIDDYTDPEDEAYAQSVADMIMDALRNPDKPRPSGECILGEMARQFWKTTFSFGSTAAQERLLSIFEEYLNAVIVEASDRDRSYIRKFEEYLEFRRETGAIKPAIAVNDFHLDLPDEVLYHPVIQTLTTAAVDLVCIDNDLYSYRAEHARGDGHNIVIVFQKQFDLDVQGAIDHTFALHNETVDRFLTNLKLVPSWGKELDLKVAAWIDGLGTWVRGNDTWSFESGRYFGTEGPEIQKTRMVTLIPAPLPCKA